MKTTQRFRDHFTRALFVASVVFATAHMLQMFSISVISNHSLKVDPAGFITLATYGSFEGVVFFVIGWPLTYVPVYVINRSVTTARWRRLIVYLSIGCLFGLAFLPLCASVPSFVTPTSDAPNYIGRCVEFAYPMTIAGILGGYAFWRFARLTEQHRELIADQFL